MIDLRVFDYLLPPGIRVTHPLRTGIGKVNDNYWIHNKIIVKIYILLQSEFLNGFAQPFGVGIAVCQPPPYIIECILYRSRQKRFHVEYTVIELLD